MQYRPCLKKRYLRNVQDLFQTFQQIQSRDQTLIINSFLFPGGKSQKSLCKETLQQVKLLQKCKFKFQQWKTFQSLLQFLEFRISSMEQQPIPSNSVGSNAILFQNENYQSQKGSCYVEFSSNTILFQRKLTNIEMVQVSLISLALLGFTSALYITNHCE